MRGQIIYQASNNLSTLIIISRKKSICLELAHDQCSVYILWFITCAYHFLAVYKRSTVNVFKAHGLAQASIADCVNETFSAVRTVSNLMLCYLFLVPMRLLHYCFFFLEVRRNLLFCVLNSDIKATSLYLCLQVRSFNGEKRQMSMFRQQVKISVNWYTLVNEFNVVGFLTKLPSEDSSWCLWVYLGTSIWE